MLIEDILPQLLIDAPECPDSVATSVIVSSAQELCRDTHVWNEIQGPITLTDGQSIYEIESPAGACPVVVMGAWCNSLELKPKSMSEVSFQLPNWSTAAGSSPVWFNSADGEGTLRLFPIPVNAGRAQMTLRVAYQPAPGATSLPSVLSHSWLETILSGALARLMLQPRKPWSDPKLGAFNAGRFDAGKQDARIRTLYDGAPGSLSVRPRAFGS